MPRGHYDRSKMTGKRGRREVPVIFDQDINVAGKDHRVTIKVDPRCFQLEMTGSRSTFSTTISGLLKQIGERLGKEALHNLNLSSFSDASTDIINACEQIGGELDKKLEVIHSEQSRK